MLSTFIFSPAATSFCTERLAGQSQIISPCIALNFSSLAFTMHSPSPYLGLIRSTLQTSQPDSVRNDSNLNPVLQMVTWLLLAAATLMLFFRLLAKFFLKGNRTPGWEEGFILVSYVSCVLLLTMRLALTDTYSILGVWSRRISNCADPK